jgi:hypothetical protein
MRGRRRRTTPSRPAPALPGDPTQTRRCAAALIAAWDGWTIDLNHLPPASTAAREQIDTLRAALADPDVIGFTAAVAGVLGGVPPPPSAVAVRAATEQLRRTAYPPRTNSHVYPALFDPPHP